MVNKESEVAQKPMRKLQQRQSSLDLVDLQQILKQEHDRKVVGSIPTIAGFLRETK